MGITDAELRERLSALGFNPPPVTDTSRALLLKKLEKLETELQGRSGAKNSNSSTVNDTSRTPSKKTQKSKNTDAELRECLIAKGVNAPPVTESNRAVLQHKLRDLERSFAETNSRVTVNAEDQYDGRTRRTRQSERARDTSPDSSVAYNGFGESGSTPPPRSMKSSRKETERVDSVVNKIKNSTPYTDSSFTKGDPFEKGSDSDDSLYSSRANSRYLVRKPIGMRRESEFFSTPSYRRYDGLNGSMSLSNKNISAGRYSRGGGKNFFSGLSWKVSTPTMVLGACLIFFVVVGGIYYSKNDRLLLDVVEQPKCSVRGRQGVTCVPDKDMVETIDALKILYRALHKRKLNVVCNGETGKPDSRMSENDVIEMLVLDSGMLRFEAEKMAQYMRVLIDANSHLGIAWSETNGFELVNADLPWSCTLRIWFAWLWDYLRYVITTIALIFSMHILVRWVTTRNKQHAKEKQDLVKGILEILQQNAMSNPSQNYLPILHVRDQLISFADRNRKRKMWLDAVKYIEENESRVRKEVQPFEGEDYDVWRWVGGHQFSAPKPKTWQGEAFETSKDTMNTPSISPTSCLKIRHMFDPKNETADEDWSTGVKDAILERCEGVHIVHIMVDESSSEGCVYIKCASTDDAGKAYRKIHGAWFDGKIVTAKYLRLERYHERFPSSVGLTKSLIPSNDQKRSLA